MRGHVSYPQDMTEAFKLEVDQHTHAWLQRRARLRGVSVPAAAAADLHDLALRDEIGRVGAYPLHPEDSEAELAEALSELR